RPRHGAPGRRLPAARREGLVARRRLPRRARRREVRRHRTRRLRAGAAAIRRDPGLRRGEPEHAQGPRPARGRRGARGRAARATTPPRRARHLDPVPGPEPVSAVLEARGRTTRSTATERRRWRSWRAAFDRDRLLPMGLALAVTLLAWLLVDAAKSAGMREAS